MALKSFTLPPDTRAVGSGNPPQDVNDILDCLFSMGGLGNVLNYGADPSGSADSTAAFTTALATGQMFIPPGAYKIAGNLSAAPPVTITGAGRSWVTLKFYGSGDCLRINTTGASSGFGVADVRGFTIDGTHASAGASGLHMGDAFMPRVDDVGVQNFQGSGSKGAWFDNQYNFMEQLTGRIWARANTANVVFDNSANPNGNPAGLGSFDRAIFDIFIDQDGVGDGVVFQDGAFIEDGRLGIYGNFSPGSSQYSALSLPATPALSFTATNASPCVFTAAGSYYGNGTLAALAGGSLPTGFTAGSYFVVNASGTSFELALTSGGTPVNSTSTGSGTVTALPHSAINHSVLNIGVELDGSGGTAPYTINFGTNSGNQGAGNQIWSCTGIMDFGASAAFASAQNPRFAFRYDGPVYGDIGLQRSMALGSQPVNHTTGLANGSTLNTKFTGLSRLSVGSNITGVIMEAFAPDEWREITFLNVGAGSITFAASGTSHVADGASDVIQPGTAATFHWSPDEVLWFRA